MTSPIKGQLSKRQFSELIEKENEPSPMNSPKKPSPKKTRTALASINGLPVEVQSPAKSPAKRALDFFEESSRETSSARRDLTAAFLQSNLPDAEKMDPVETIKRKSPALPTFNVTHLLAQREERLAPLKFDVEYWNEQATHQETARETLRCLSLAAAGASHTPDKQKELLVSLAIKQLESEKYIDAMLTCDQIEHFFSSDLTPALLIQGICLLKGKKYADSFEIFNKAICKKELASQEEPHLHIEFIDKSIDALQIAKDKESENIPLTLQFLKLIYELQCTNHIVDEAIDTLQEQEELLPGSTLLEQGFCYLQLDMIEESIALFTEALEKKHQIVNPTFDSLMRAASLILNEDRSLTTFQLGREYINWALTRPHEQEKKEQALILKCDCEFNMGQYSEALATLQSLEALHPNHYQIFIYLLRARCYFKSNLAEVGAKLLIEALTLKDKLTINNTRILLDCTEDLIHAGYQHLSTCYLKWAQEKATS